MRFADACIPLGAAWSSPFVRWQGPAAVAAEHAATAVQVPVYESLTDREIERVGRLVRKQVSREEAAHSGKLLRDRAR